MVSISTLVEREIFTGTSMKDESILSFKHEKRINHVPRSLVDIILPVLIEVALVRVSNSAFSSPPLQTEHTSRRNKVKRQ